MVFISEKISKTTESKRCHTAHVTRAKGSSCSVFFSGTTYATYVICAAVIRRHLAGRGCNGPAKQRLRGPKASWLADGAPAVSLRLPTRHRVLPPAPRVAQPSSHHQRPLGVQRRRRSRPRAGLLLMLPWTSEHPRTPRARASSEASQPRGERRRLG